MGFSGRRYTSFAGILANVVWDHIKEEYETQHSLVHQSKLQIRKNVGVGADNGQV